MTAFESSSSNQAIATLGTNINEVLEEAERCRREARATVEKNRALYPDLVGQPSGWCIVTKKGLWSRQFHTMLDVDRLREKIEKGHRVVLTVGLVANPAIPLCASNHAAFISIAEPRAHKSEKLAYIGIRAKVCAATALFNQ